MNVFVVGCWDGVTVWVQWDGADAAGYQVVVRFKAAGASDWEPWRRIGGLGPITQGWMTIPTHREGASVQARVAILGTESWVDAAEAMFDAPSCRFRFESTQRVVHFLTGTQFHCIVDGEAAYYELGQEIELEAGGAQEVTMRACDKGGYHQLDYPAHFEMRPSLGLSISNVAPSDNDLKLTGRDFTVLTRLARTGPLRIVFGRTGHFDGAASPAQ